MTGVRAGSQGTGLRAGSWGGSGVAGGESPTPIWVGGAASAGTYNTTFETPSMTALDGAATYFAVVQLGGTGGWNQSTPSTLSGMGLTWTRVSDYHFDSSGTHTQRMDVFKSEPGAVASNGALTVTVGNLGGEINVAVVGFIGDVRLLEPAVQGVTAVSPLSVAVPDLATSHTILVANAEGGATGDPGDHGAEQAVLGRSGTTHNGFESSWSWDKGDAAAITEATFSNDKISATYLAAGVVFTVASGLVAYAPNVLKNSFGGVSVFPLAEKGSMADIESYDVQVLDVDPVSMFPLAEKGTIAGELAHYNDLDLGQTFFVDPAAKTSGPTVPQYNDEISSKGRTFFVDPAAKTAGPDIEAYSPPAANRHYPFQQVGIGETLSKYSDIVSALSPTRHYPLQTISELEAAITALTPVSYWKMNEAASPAVDLGSLGNNLTATGGVTWANEQGPDGEFYPTFDGSTGYLSAGDADEYSINTVDGTTFVVSFKATAWTGTPLLLGKFKVSDNEWFIKFDASGTGEDLTAEIHNTGQAFPFMNAVLDGPSAALDGWNTLVVVFPAGDTPPVIYFNDDTAATTTDTAASGTREPDNTGPLTIGGSASSAGFFTGSIANVAVFDSALSGANITSIINAAKADGWVESPLSRAIRRLDPAGYWKLDDETNVFEDSSGNGHTGTGDLDVLSRDIAGPDGKSYTRFLNDEFGLDRGLITIPHDAGFDPDGHGLTVVALVNTDTADLMYPIVKRPLTNQYSESGWQIDHSGADWRSSILSDTGSTFRESTDSASVVLDQWQLVVVRMDDQSTPNEIELFVDSATKTSTQNTGNSGTYNSNANAPLSIGGFPWTEYYGMNGGMAHVAVFPTKLSDVEVAAIHAAAVEEGWIS